MNRKSTEFKKMLAYALILSIMTFALAACGGRIRHPLPETAPPSSNYPLSGKSYVIDGQRYYTLASASGYREKGLASWYGSKFHGRKTANGEIYDMHGLTAAHKTLPLNTWVKVTNLRNGKDITVRVNDRGPFVRDRLIDMSYAGARMLGMVDDGVAPVTIEALGTPEKRMVNGQVRTVLVQPDNYEVGRFGVQVGSFQEQANAQALADRLRNGFTPVTVELFDRGDAIFYRVRVSDKKTLGQALDVQAQLEKQGFRDCFVVAR